MKKYFLLPIEIVSMSLDNIRAQKFRSFLTVLGIVIGVITVIAIASILTGLRNNMVKLIEEYGTNNIYAFHLSTGFRVGPRDRAERMRRPLTLDDVRAIKQQAPAVEEVSYVLFVGFVDETLTHGKNSYKRGDLQGVSPNYAKTANVIISEGRFFTDIDEQHKRDVIVLGVNAAEALFPNQTNIVGSEVALDGKPYEVVGVLEKRKGSFFGENEEDSAIFIPFGTARKLSPRSEYMMVISRSYTGQLANAMDQIERVLRNQRNVKFNEPNNFDLSTSDKIIEQFDSITGMLGIVAIAISGIGLMVGGIGVMNIMLVSVTERTREIGIRKAIGARRRDIVIQFLCEAMTLTFLGGLLGVILAIGVSRIIILLLPSLPATVPLWAVITGLTVSIMVGLIFGVWPARKAARLDPIECLRYE